MFRPKKMIKIGVVTPSTMVDKIIDQLYSLKAIEIQDHKKDDSFDIGSPLEIAEDISSTSLLLNSIASHINLDLSKEFRLKQYNYDYIKERINEFHSNIKNNVEKIDFYKKALPIIRNNTYKKALSDISLNSLPKANDHDSVLFCGLLNQNIENEIMKISQTSNVISKDVDGAYLTLIFVSKSRQKEIKEILEKHFFIGLDKNNIKESLSFKASLIDMHMKIAEIVSETRKTQNKFDREIKEIKSKHEEFILSSNKILKSELEKAEAPIRFAATRYTHIISGFIPKSRFDEIKSKLEEESNNKVYVHTIDLEKKEQAPVLLDNIKIAKPFQFLLDLFAFPTYKEIDPTFLMFMTFPLFFGFMLGDMGYGVLTLILFLLAKLKFKKGAMRPLLNILVLSSIGTIIFGALFGEVFGEEVIFGYELPHILSRAHQITDLLSLAIIIGLVHVAIGYIIGFVNVYRDHGLKHAIMEKAGWLMLFPIVIWTFVNFLSVIIGVYAKFVSIFIPPFPIMIAIAVIGAILIISGEGIIGAIELPAILSNILSYARLMAVGLASVELALIINEMAKQMFASGGIMIIFAVLILLIGHIINIMLGLLGPFLHSLRLHYVEFFGKFYRGGGKKFTPFGEDLE